MNWHSNEFLWIDWVIIAVGILSVTWAVWRAVQKQKRLQGGESSRNYFLGGEPWFVMGAAIFAANIGSEHLVGLAGAGAETGMGMAHWEMQGWMILILGWLFVPFYKHSGVFTMPEFLNRRYTRNTSSWLSIITLISYVLTKVSVTAFTGGIFMESLLGLPFWYGAIGLVLLTGVFTVFGGMKGVMTLSKIQTPILIVGSFLVLFLGLYALGGGSITEGWTDMIAHAKSLNEGHGTNHLMHFETGDPLYDKFPGVWVFIGAAIIGFWYWCTDQHIVQRVLGGKDMKEMRRGTILAGYLKILPVFMFLIPGMIAAALAARPESGFAMGTNDEAFGSMVKFVLPAGVKGVVTVGFICALVASLAAFFNSCATLYTVDFYKPKHPEASEKKLVWIGRAATWVVVVLGLVWIPIMMGLGSLYKYLQEVQSLLAPAIVAVFVMGIFSKKITPKAGEAGIIVGFVIGMIRLVANIFKDKLNTMDLTAIDWFWNTNWLIFEIYLLVFTVLVMIAVSFFTKKAGEEKLKGITFFTQSPAQKAETKASWNYWDIITSAGVVAVCVLFYIYFW
jgi:SSS family solute:Na+ symporter